ncbi:DUF3179 domain-containing protein [Candidatus Poribacteria bacterium]|nr:DUF3179 domain-containing protein [Candidatus Poribacteria bacterium]
MRFEAKQSFFLLVLMMIGAFIVSCGDDDEEIEMMTQEEVVLSTRAEGPPVKLRERIDPPLSSFPEGIQHSIPLEDIVFPGVPVDVIYALTDPKSVPADSPEASYLKDTDRVLGITINRKSRAYPIKILNWHEVLNDQIFGAPVLITFCPLCGTGITFDPQFDKSRRHIFGVSGYLYNSDLLLYNRETHEEWYWHEDKTTTLWSQILGEAVIGPFTGIKLKTIPTTHTTWKEWRTMHPDTTVMSEDTNFPAHYDFNPYEGYDPEAGAPFHVTNEDARLPNNALVHGLNLNGEQKVYPLAILEEQQVVNDRLGGVALLIVTTPGSRTVRIYNRKGHRFSGDFNRIVDEKGHQWEFREEILRNSVTGEVLKRVSGGMDSFWFGWVAFFPNTLIYDAVGTIK